MKIKLDENLPIRLVPLLTDLGHDVETVPDEQIAGRDDDVVWSAAQANGRFLVTQDLDFSDARKYAPGTHHGLLLIRLPQPSRTALFDRVSTLFRTEAVDSWRGASSRRRPGRSASKDLNDMAVIATTIDRAFSLVDEDPPASVRSRFAVLGASPTFGSTPFALDPERGPFRPDRANERAGR